MTVQRGTPLCQQYASSIYVIVLCEDEDSVLKVGLDLLSLSEILKREHSIRQVVVLGLCILSAYLIRRNRFYYLPESAAAILVGVVVGGMAKLFYPTKDELDFLTFNSVRYVGCVMFCSIPRAATACHGQGRASAQGRREPLELSTCPCLVALSARLR